MKIEYLKLNWIEKCEVKIGQKSFGFEKLFVQKLKLHFKFEFQRWVLSAVVNSNSDKTNLSQFNKRENI